MFHTSMIILVLHLFNLLQYSYAKILFTYDVGIPYTRYQVHAVQLVRLSYVRVYIFLNLKFNF